ncbi:YcxB family protein [Nostoc sp. CHAB 5844]|nr:YcxB family protein [Nostoc sp. CHAB 5844]
MTSSIAASTRQRAAQRQIAAFTRRFGDAHLYLSYHAAFPLSLTPELLYRLWANFQTDQTGAALNIPWIAVADLLLSGLCREVGHELYEMDAVVRIELLNQLQNEPRFGSLRIQQLAEFVLSYVHYQLKSPDPDLREVARTQRWTALAYTRPGTATRELIAALSELHLNESAQWLRLTSLVETLADPLAEFKPLLSYSRGMKLFMRGRTEEATAELLWLAETGRIQIGGMELPVPEQIRRNFMASAGERSQVVQNQHIVAVTTSPDVNSTMPHAPIIRLYQKLTSEDYIKALYFHTRASSSLWAKLIIFFAILAWIVILGTYIIQLLLSGNFVNFLGSLFVPSLLIASLYYLFGIDFPRKIRRNFQQFKVMQVPSDTTISPEIIETISEISMKRLRISDFYMYRVNSNFILVYLLSLSYLIFPRRCFNSDEDFQQFLVYLKAVFGKPGKPIKRKSLPPRNLAYRASSSLESTISFRIQLTTNDYIKANYLHLRPATELRVYYLLLLGIYISLGGFLSYSVIILGGNIADFIFWLSLGICGLYLYFFLLPSRVRRISSQSTYVTFEHQVEISPEMLEVVEVTGTTRMRLADFHKYKVSQELIVLYPTDRSFYIFPRRCFPSEADVQTFLSYLQTNLGSPKS